MLLTDVTRQELVRGRKDNCTGIGHAWRSLLSFTDHRIDGRYAQSCQIEDDVLRKLLRKD